VSLVGHILLVTCHCSPVTLSMTLSLSQPSVVRATDKNKLIKSIHTKNEVKFNEFLQNATKPLLYRRGHYFHGTPVRWSYFWQTTEANVILLSAKWCIWAKQAGDTVCSLGCTGNLHIGGKLTFSEIMWKPGSQVSRESVFVMADFYLFRFKVS